MTSMQPKTLLLVDGIDGSGKSTFARLVANSLGRIRVSHELVAIDDFRKPQHWRGTGKDAVTYYENYYDLERVRACANAYLDNATDFAQELWDPETGTPSELKRWRLDTEVLIMEGIFGLRACGKLPKLHVYVDASYEDARERILARDQTRGRHRDDIINRIDGRYFPGQRRYNEEFTPQAAADIVVYAARSPDWRLAADHVPARVRNALDHAINSFMTSNPNR